MFEITVPRGPRRGRERPAHRSTPEDDLTGPPIGAYLATASIGDYVVNDAPGTVFPIIDAVTLRNTIYLARCGVLRGALRRLRFNSGAIVDDDTVGYVLEMQTRPFFSECEGGMVADAVHEVTR